MTYILKQELEDFIVDEVLHCEFEQRETPQTKFAVYKLTKQNLNTIQVVDMITKHFRFKQNDVGYAGIKDRYGITTQYISIPNIDRARDMTFSHENITLEHVGYLKHAISGKILLGNTFKIVVRNAQDYKITEQDWMLNYFGEQRFSKNNVKVGRLLIQQKFKEATQEMLAFAQTNPTYNERILKDSLDKNPTDVVSALRKLPGRTLAFYVHAYQSYMFNVLLSKSITNKTHEDKTIWAAFTNTKPDVDEKLPVLGFYYKPEEYSKSVQNIMSELMEEENITSRSFIIRSMTEITEPGAVRQSIVPIQDLKTTDNNETKTFEFFLPKGAYATVALRQLLTSKE